MDRITKAIKQANKTRSRSEGAERLVSEFGTGFENRIDIPKQVLEDRKLIAGMLTHPVSEAYRLLRTRVLRVMEQNNWRVIGVTGPSSGSGKTLTAANLAVGIAMKPNFSSLLVEADLRKVGLSKLFDIDPDYDLEDFLGWKASLEDVVVCPGIDDLGVIVNKRPLHGSSDLLMGDALMVMIDQIKLSQENLVAIFDLPPVFVGDDAVALSAHLDAVLVVVDSTNTSKESLQGCLELLKGVNIIGCVLNNATDVENLNTKYGGY